MKTLHRHLTNAVYFAIATFLFAACYLLAFVLVTTIPAITELLATLALGTVILIIAERVIRVIGGRR